uniref:BZIP domain-containing protein n=1 Tax=Strongyloides venezuelensis TaxID=75913 RepID=A0A0K0FCB4_STRVS
MVTINMEILTLIFAFAIYTSSFIVNPVEENTKAILRRSLIANSDGSLISRSFEDENKLSIKRQARRRRVGARGKRGGRRGGKKRRQIRRIKNQISNLQDQLNSLQNTSDYI